MREGTRGERRVMHVREMEVSNGHAEGGRERWEEEWGGNGAGGDHVRREGRRYKDS